jgi:two-component system chemotaxis sensor kinase CheA
MNRLLQRLERVAYDVAQEQGKPITIIVQGAEVELDKSVIDRMTDPLVHMVRNAVDHGVEPKGSRPSHKPAEATITLTASKSASGVQIELADDGRGIDPEKVLKKAVSLGLVKEGEQIPLKKIYEFLFAPGFSTAEKLTDISGRGVGLDVVRRMVDDLEGTLEIHSELGQGTKFTIVLPTNVSIIDSLVVLASGQHYVVPIQEVAEVIDLRSYHIESQTQRGKTIALREKAVTICPLQVFIPDSKPHSLLQTKPHQKESQQTLPSPAMIIDISGEKVGFEFEQVIGQQPILIRKLAGYIAGIPGFSGSTILATGEPAVILSPRVFARQYLSDKEVH